MQPHPNPQPAHTEASRITHPPPDTWHMTHATPALRTRPIHRRNSPRPRPVSHLVTPCYTLLRQKNVRARLCPAPPIMNSARNPVTEGYGRLRKDLFRSQ